MKIPRDKFAANGIITGLSRPYGLAVRTPPFHGGSPGSIPGRVAILERTTSPNKIKHFAAFSIFIFAFKLTFYDIFTTLET